MHPLPSNLLRPTMLAAALGAGTLTLGGGCGKSNARQAVAPPSIVLRDAAAESGLDFSFSHGGKSPLNILETSGFGGGFIDVDGDGLLDVVITGHSGCAMFRNRGGRFERVPDGAGLPTKGMWLAPAVGDFDNDGRQDLFISGYRDQRLFRNVGGRFQDVTDSAGLRDTTHWSSSAAFVDLDNDGALDLFVCRYVKFGAGDKEFCEDAGQLTACSPGAYQPERGVLYRNLGKGRFAPAHAAALQASAGKSWGVFPLDANDDGWTDLYVSNDTEPADLWMNQQGKSLKNTAFQNGVALTPAGRPYGGMGITAADFNGDDQQDLFLASYTDEPKSLFLNGGEGPYADGNADWGLGSLRPLVSWGCSAEDFDLDRWPDLLCVSGHVIDNYAQVDARSVASSYRQPLKLFRNQEGKSFEEIEGAPGSAVGRDLVGRGLAAGDYDNDGRVDVLVIDLEGPALLLHNETPPAGRHWIGVELEGKRSNRMALGCRVRVAAGGRVQTSEARTGGSVFAARDSRVVFGLGSLASVDWVEVRWADGSSTRLEAPAVDQYLKIREGDTARKRTSINAE